MSNHSEMLSLGDSAIAYTPTVQRQQEINRLYSGLRASCNVLDERSGQHNHWSFNPYSFASSINRWKEISHRESQLGTTQRLTQRDLLFGALNNMAELLVNSQSLARVTTPANFDLTARVFQEIYRTSLSADYANEEEGLIFAAARGEISIEKMRQAQQKLYERWASQSPIQLTEDLGHAESIDARQRFARAARYEARIDLDTGLLIFWDNDHLFNQFTRHQTRLYDGGSIDTLRNREQTIQELKAWLDSTGGQRNSHYLPLIEAAEKNPEHWPTYLYRVWLARQVEDMIRDAGTGKRELGQFFDLLEFFLTPRALEKFKLARSMPNILYLGSESLTYARQTLAAGADLGGAAIGVKDGLTRGEIYSPIILRGQPEASHRFWMDRGAKRVWLHEFTYLLTAASLSLDYDFAFNINSGPQEGILHALLQTYDWIRFTNKRDRILPIEQRRKTPTVIRLPATFFTPRIYFAGDDEKEQAAEDMLVQLGLRYHVDDDGQLSKIPGINRDEVKLPLLSNGCVDLEKANLTASEIGTIHGYALARGELAFWSQLWNESVEPGAVELWGSTEYPGREMATKLEPMGIEVLYPPKEEIEEILNTDWQLKNKARSIWNV